MISLILTLDVSIYVEYVSMGGRVFNESHLYTLKKYSLSVICQCY